MAQAQDYNTLIASSSYLGGTSVWLPTNSPPTMSGQCILEISESFRRGKTFVRQYFEGLVAHIVSNGVRHEADGSSDFLAPLITADPVAGAFKIWVLDSDCPWVEEAG
jgi:hypothetical protein